jgi:N-acetylglucosaminyldiphosphoundecaprenol N-acetyl-beta-D-mannosaminyltransferase
MVPTKNTLPAPSGFAPVLPERSIARRRPTRVEICGLPIDNVTMEAALDAMMVRLETRTKTRLYFVNADCVNISHRDPEYRRTVQCGELVFADGSGMRLAGRVLGIPIVDNVNGTDFFPLACERLAGSGKRVFLLGGRPGVAEKVRAWAHEQHPGLEICGVHHGYFDRARSGDIAAQIRESGADVLLVAFGAPAQEKWIAAHMDATGVTVALGVGGLFDFYSGNVPRAPLWMRRAGLEWLYRFAQEPRRMWKRYWIGNFVFVARVLRDAAKPTPGTRLALGREAR